MSGAMPTGPLEGCGGVSPSVKSDTIPVAQRVRARDRRRMQWTGGTLVVLFIVLAPWGGQCDRRGRPADPTTLRSVTMCGPASEPPPSVRDAGRGDAGLEIDPAILEEEDGEGLGVRSISGPMSPLVPPSPASLGAGDCDRHHDHSGRSARSPFLRC
jgi:hypothetical protein